MKNTTIVLQLVLVSQVAWLSSLSAHGLKPTSFSQLWQIERLSTRGSSYPAVSIDQAIILQSDPEAVLIDARNKEQYDQEHIPLAISLPLNAELTPEIERILENGPRIVVYCSSKSCDSSELVANYLSALGYKNISILTDGWRGWQERGLPVKIGEAP